MAEGDSVTMRSGGAEAGGTDLARRLAEGWKPFPVQGGFEALIGPLYARRVEEGIRFAFLAQPQHANPRGIVHGGMLMSLADHMLGAMVWHAVGKRFCATVSLNCDFLGPARIGDWIEGQGEISRKGQSLVYVRGELLGGNGVVMTANGIWKILGAS